MSVIKLHRTLMISSGTLVKKILLLIRASTTLGHIIKLFTLGIYIKKILPRYFGGLQNLAL